MAGLDAHYGIRSRPQDPAATLLFSRHWAGTAGVVAGTDCGDLGMEAVHAPWQTQLNVLGSNVPATPVFDTVRKLYHVWGDEKSTHPNRRASLRPDRADPDLLNAASLKRVGRSNGLQLWLASQKQATCPISWMSLWILCSVTALQG